MEKPFPAYNGEDPYIFVCYAHDDEDVVYPEMAWLHEQGINLWYDEGISGGKIWREEIGDAIKGAFRVLYYISESSLASDHCDREINFALDHTSVLPVYLDDVELTTDLEVGLGRVQALHRTADQDYQGHLLGALGQSVEVTRPLPRSRQRVRLQRDVDAALKPEERLMVSERIRELDPAATVSAAAIGGLADIQAGGDSSPFGH